MKKRILLAVLAALALLVAVLVARTATYASRQLTPERFEPVPVDQMQLAERLARAIQIKTISYQDQSRSSGEAFRKLHALFEQAFPKTHAALKREIVNEYSLLYTWAGTDPSTKPILLLAHMDVVPADGHGAAKWTHPPFSGAIADGYIWGRGAVDDKACALGILEAIEALLRTGFKPARTIYIAFGHDEEVGGSDGAGQIASLLKSRGVKAAFSLDEGLAITDGIVPGMPCPLALVAIAEKGYLSLELVVEQKGGHSSQPPQQTAIGILAQAITRLEKNPMPARLEGPVRRMFDYAGPEMRFTMRLVLANLWLLRPLVMRQLASSPATNAVMRTTTAATIIQAGTQENVLPAMARAVVNFRLLPGDTIQDVVEHVREVIDDSRVAIGVTPRGCEASPVSDDKASGFVSIDKSIRQVWPEVAVAPGLALGGTDSKHYVGVAENLYRFTPFWFRDEDLAMIHGTNERASIERYAQAVQFFVQVIRNAASGRQTKGSTRSTR